MQSTTLKDKTYLLRFVTLHEGYGGGHQKTVVKPKGKKKEMTTEAHYFGYVCNFATTQWFKLDDENVVEVEEDDVLKNAQDKAYMLHYVLMGSEEYLQCYQEDISFCPSPKGSSVSSSSLAIADKTIGETGKSKDKMTGKGTTALNSTAADETQSHSTTVLLETGKETQSHSTTVKEGFSVVVTKSLASTVVLETRELSTKDSVSDKLSEGTKSQHLTVVLETGKEPSTKEGVSDQTAVLETEKELSTEGGKEPSTKDSVSDKLSEGTKSQPKTVVLETVKELSTEGVTDQIFSTTPVLSQGTKSHPTTEYHPTPVRLETGKEPSTKEGAPDNLSEITKSQPRTVVLETGKQTSAKEGVSDKMLSTTQVLSLGTKSHPSTVVLEPGKESNPTRMSTTSSQETLPATKESYLDAIHEMYPEMIITKLSNYLPYFEDWATVRAAAALKAFMAVKDMIAHGNLVYDNRASLSDDDSDDSVASYMQKKPKKHNLDDEDKKFFTSLPTCYSMFFCFETFDVIQSYCPFSSHNKCWQNKNSLEALLDGYECKSKPFKRDELGQHVKMSHSKSWCGEGVRIFLNEMYPSRLTAKPLTQKKKSKSRMKKILVFSFVLTHVTVQFITCFQYRH